MSHDTFQASEVVESLSDANAAEKPASAAVVSFLKSQIALKVLRRSDSSVLVQSYS